MRKGRKTLHASKRFCTKGKRYWQRCEQLLRNTFFAISHTCAVKLAQTKVGSKRASFSWRDQIHFHSQRRISDQNWWGGVVRARSLGACLQGQSHNGSVDSRAAFWETMADRLQQQQWHASPVGSCTWRFCAMSVTCLMLYDIIYVSRVRQLSLLSLD